ncbi:PRD domain-containing protein [Streptomyces niger]|uniref:PRD domain-containing protein n=1 Tax=Streptomyces niger TaxID=66373 RepID=UPI00069A7ED4|nr:PRD domain-containing protein [Streptomyces niger]
MEDRLALRIQVFRDSGQAPPQVMRFVEEELGALAAEGHTVTEDTAGMLTSHLVMALTRLLNGEPIEQFLTDEEVAAELAGHPDAVERARAVSLRAERELGATLPDSEINFLAMHLALLHKNAVRRDVS